MRSRECVRDQVRSGPVTAGDRQIQARDILPESEMTHMQAPLWSAIGASGVELVQLISTSSLVCRKFFETGEPGCQEAECEPRRPGVALAITAW